MTDLIGNMTPEQVQVERLRLESISPDDGKYSKESGRLAPYISAAAEWKMCAHIQLVLLATRAEFGQAGQEHVEAVRAAVERFDPLNAALLEGRLKHDQLAVLEELGRWMPQEIKALLHPGTTSYDILDTARSALFKSAWGEVIRPKVAEVVGKLCTSAEEYTGVLQAGRTHLQRTSPVPFSATLALYAARLAGRTEFCDTAFAELRGKVSGIVGTGASIDAVIGEGQSLAFEERVLAKLGLRPDLTATQIIQKERLADAGHGLVTLACVLGDFANDMRILYSSDISEVTSREGKSRLGGSSADASKNNPTDWENTAGKSIVIQSGMPVLYAMIQSDLQRDLRGSVQGRYQPQQMMVQVYESFCRTSRSLDQLSVNRDRMTANLESVRTFPSEAMVAIMRAHGWIHPQYGIGHDAVKEFSKAAQQRQTPLLDIALADEHFERFFSGLNDREQRILRGELELYTGSSDERARRNIEYARSVAGRHTYGTP